MCGCRTPFILLQPVLSGEVTRGSGVEIQRNLPNHFEWLLAIDDEVDEVALAAGQLFDHVFGSGPDACICAVDFCGQKQDEGCVGEVHGGSGLVAFQRLS